jgi:hypothetical protein
MYIEYEYTDKETGLMVKKCFFETGVNHNVDYWSEAYGMTVISDELTMHANPQKPITIKMLPLEKKTHS